MTLMTEKSLGVRPDPTRWYDRLLTPAMWGTLAIIVMWLAVLFVGVYGGDVVNAGNDGTSTRIPSAVAVALFASLATAAVAKRAFGRRTDVDKR